MYIILIYLLNSFVMPLSLRYNWSLMLMPPTCDGCGAAFTLSHALGCKRGRLVIRCHNEICDAFGPASIKWDII